MKAAKYTCIDCGGKQSKAKGREFAVMVHHKDGIDNWEKVIDLVFAEILCPPERLEVLCPACHDKRHQRQTSFTDSKTKP
jgi:predicted HNH restriction endonuclease